MTPLFPSTAKTFATSIEPGPQEKVEWHAREFVTMASKRYGDLARTWFYADLDRIRLPKGLKHVEHVRGMGFEIYASSAPRCGMHEK